MAEHPVKIKKEQGSSHLTDSSDGNHYPFGTSLHLDDDMLEELGMGGLGVGDIVKISAFAFVDSRSEHSDRDGSDKSIRLQLTSIELQREEGDRAQQLYGDN
jgi:hypothetical protein